MTQPGPLEPVTPAVGRLLAPNPGPMTLDGTNTWLLRGDASGAAVVVDPGPAHEPHLRLIAEQGPVALIVLTHHHPDHAEGADRLHQLTGAPVTAFEPDLCQRAAPLADGDRHDEGGLDWEILHTPGHSRDSVCLLLRGERLVLTGDTVLGRGTTVVAHPDGRLGDYLASLRRLRDVATAVDRVLPGHGPIGSKPLEMLDFYLQHRQERLAQVAAAVDTLGPESSAMDIVRHVYADVDEAVWPAAELSVRAQLDYLAETRAGSDGQADRRPATGP